MTRSDAARGAVVRALTARILATATRRWTLMAVSGEPAYGVVIRGVSDAIAPAVEILHGPGCPICVLPPERGDTARRVAALPNVLFTSSDDLLRAPGPACDRHAVPARGTRVVHSPLDALDLAVKHPDREVVFFAVGFEPTAAATATAVWRARRLGVQNFSLLVAHVTLPPAMTAVLVDPANRTQAFLVAGHASGVMGWADYEPIAAACRVPIVVTSFEPADVLEGIQLAVQQLEEGRYEVENQYVRSGRREAPPGRALVAQIFRLVDREWRRIGTMPASGLALRTEYADYDAELRFGLGLGLAETATPR